MSAKEYKAFLNLPGGGETTKCYYPFKLDTYGCGCSNNCAYCYAKSVLSFRGYWDNDAPKKADFNKIKKIFENVFDKGKKTKYSQFFLDRIPIRLGGMTDCFSDIEKEERVTLRFLKLLKKYDYPYLILTKNKLVADDEYIEAMDKNLGYIQFSITTPFDDISEAYEEGASLTSERLAACKKLNDHGFYTAVRICPLFPLYPDGHYSNQAPSLNLGGNCKPKKFRYFDWSLLDMIQKTANKTVIAGFVRLSSWNIKWIKNKTGKDLTWLFDAGTKVKNQALHFSSEEIRYYYEKIKKSCDDLGMEFSVCYDGDDAYEEFRYLWANPNDCCNGKGKIPGFKNAFDFESDAFIKVADE